MLMERTMNDLYELQKTPLIEKIEMTKDRIDEWIEKFGTDGVYVSFSGGKDSTVLLDIVRNECGYKEIPAVFIDVPTQYPELREFAKKFDNVEIIKPHLNFMKVVEQYGFPMISKETSECVYYANLHLDKLAEAELNGESTENIPYSYKYRQLTGEGEYSKTSNPKGKRYSYSQEKYKFFLDAPFDISHMCCNVMKKKPAHLYEKDTGRKPIIATMASESKLRTQKWLQHGCNAFEGTKINSKPMSFWTEQDVLAYIYAKKLPICSVYGDVVIDGGDSGDVIDFMTLDYSSEDRPKLKTTGCERTGCALCAYGAHLDKGDHCRFKNLHETHPGMYNLLDIIQNNGVTYREAIEWLNEHGNGVHIEL